MRALEMGPAAVIEPIALPIAVRPEREAAALPRPPVGLAGMALRAVAPWAVAVAILGPAFYYFATR